MKEGKVVLVTGATGKVGQNLIRRFMDDSAWEGAKVRAFCHNRLLEPDARLEVVQGSMAEREDVARAAALKLGHMAHEGLGTRAEAMSRLAAAAPEVSASRLAAAFDEGASTPGLAVLRWSRA